MLNYTFILLVLVITLIILLVFRQRNLSKRIRLLIEKGVDNITTTQSSAQEKQKTVPTEVSNLISRQLDEFEKSDGFLKVDLSQAELAKKFETNSSYLSKYINETKAKNFPSYIKSLRIKYSVEKLKEEPSLLKYNIKGLSEKFGFQSADAFSRAFQKETNVKPSQFIKQLMKKNSR